jgi:phosphate acetyltransferase
MPYVENRTFDEITLGDSATLVRTLSTDDLSLFAVMSGDVTPTHTDAQYAQSDTFHTIIASGIWGTALISTLLGTTLPGAGTVYLGQTLRFPRPVEPGDTITVSVKAAAKDEQTHRVTFECECTNQRGEAVIRGDADVIAPTEKVKRPRGILPDVRLPDRGARYRHLIDMTRGLVPIRTAVVHPVDRHALLGALDAAHANLIVPLLIGPEAQIRAAAAAASLDLAPYRLIPTTDRHEAAATAVAMARAGDVEALMKGSLHTDELMHEVVARQTGLATERRISHVFVMDVPTYPRPLFITDAAINITPDLNDKRDIAQNAIDLARVLGLDTPRVAVLSAVETVTPKLPSTLDAAALCKMADRGQITGGILDGPLAFDNAVSEEAAKIKSIASPVAGKADILLVPDLEAGNMLVKQLGYLAEAQGAGIVLGARVPIILTSRADTVLARMASCAVALIAARRRERAAP